MNQNKSFDYNEAFSRNIGWVTEWEQQLLRGKKIAIAGLGGVGGIHLLTLARLGIQNFHIADLDKFELANFNRQVGASVSSLNQSKVDTLAAMAADINPNVTIKTFPKGITEQNISEFLNDIDLYIDGLDFFVLEIRQKIFQRCHELKIPVVTAAPLGMGVAYLIFMPGQMTFQEYFGFDPKSPEKNPAKFLAGLNPDISHRTYLVDKAAANFKDKRVPSTIISCNLAAGVASTEALKILLNRGKVYAAPWYQYFDAYRNTWSKGYLSGGHRNLIQRLRVALVSKAFIKFQENVNPNVSSPLKNDIEAILDYAKWTPSGDNSQPWQFEIKSESEFNFHLENEGSVYDFDSKPSIMTIGFFIESFRVAASHFGYNITWSYNRLNDKKHLVNLHLIKSAEIKEDSLFPFIKIRNTNRNPYTLKPLTAKQKAILEESLGENLKIRWFESFSQRFQLTEISAYATFIRLSIKETCATHQHIVDYKNAYSPDKIPIKALGISPPTQKLMKFQMRSWTRVNLMNKLIGAAIVPQIELSYLPGLVCAAHYIIEWKNPRSIYTSEDFVKVGQNLQRFWLTGTQLGLAMQPNIAPLALSYYAIHNIPFTKNAAMQKKARNLTKMLERITSVENIVYLGRLGTPMTTFIDSRSVRKTLPELLKS